MIRVSIFALPLLLASASAAPPAAVTWAQEEETETVKGRVTNYVDGSGAVIDRGSFDGLKTGDRVTFTVRGGDKYGKVVEIQRRVALVRPEDTTFKPKPGSKVKVVIPVSRFDEPPQESTPKPKPVEEPKPVDGAKPKAGAGDPKAAQSKPGAKPAQAKPGAEAAQSKPGAKPAQTNPGAKAAAGAGAAAAGGAKAATPPKPKPNQAKAPKQTPKPGPKQGAGTTKTPTGEPAQKTKAAPKAAQDDPTPKKKGSETVTARVTRFLEGTGVVIDRGTIDGLRTGDRVVFTARGGAREFGTIVGLEGRVAIVRPQDPAFSPVPGTPATIEINTARFDEEVPVTPSGGIGTGVGAGVAAGIAAGGGETLGAIGPEGDAKPKRRWTNQDDDWSDDMPLLAQVEAVDPVDRVRKISGRTYFSYDQIFDTDNERADTITRGGLALFADNPLGYGGRAHFDGEINYRSYDVPEDYGYAQDDSNARLDRLSYSIGGTRFTPSRWQFGRFLQSGMPEFGVLDGAEWGSRLDGGDSYGVSLGYLPEPDDDQKSFQDLQVAGYYRWVADLRELFTVTTGFQKTWHNGNSDRDLFIGKMEYRNPKGWNMFANAWVDIYDADDVNKDSGPALTYAIFDLRRSLSKKSGISLEYRHQEYPELLRYDYRPVNPYQLQDAHVDRLGLSAWRWLDGTAERRGKRLYGRVGAWEDEEDSGGDIEVGVDVQGVFGPSGRFDLAVYGAEGKFTSHVGGRVRYGKYGPSSSWSIMLDMRQNDITGFLENNDDLILYRARWNYEFFKASGLSANLSADVQHQDIEDQLFIGIFLQRSF